MANALATVAGASVIRATIVRPLLGAWRIDLDVERKTALTGAVDFALGSRVFRGTVAHGAVYQDTWRGRIVGGAAGLQRVLAPKFYRALPLSVPLADILATSGETLAGSSSAAVLAFRMEAWTRFEDVAGACLSLLVTAGGGTWRVLEDGTLWIGTESWPALRLTYQQVAFDSNERRLEIASEYPDLRPGVTLDGQRIATVVDTIERAQVRTQAWIA